MSPILKNNIKISNNMNTDIEYFEEVSIADKVLST